MYKGSTAAVGQPGKIVQHDVINGYGELMKTPSIAHDASGCVNAAGMLEIASGWAYYFDPRATAQCQRIEPKNVRPLLESEWVLHATGKTYIPKLLPGD